MAYQKDTASTEVYEPMELPSLKLERMHSTLRPIVGIRRFGVGKMLLPTKYGAWHGERLPSQNCSSLDLAF